MLGQYSREVLPNGLRVLGVENRALHSFVCSVYVRMGPRFEPPEHIGLAHFVEHMIMQGSESFPTSNAIMGGVEDLGGVIDAGTYPEYVNFVFGVHRKHWPRLMEIASDVLLHPLFDEGEMEQEKRIIAQEISQHRDRDGHNISASELTYSLLFRQEADEAGTRGSPELLDRFDKPTVADHYYRSFTPGNVVICLAGGFDFNEVIGCIGESFGAMKATDVAPELLPPPEGRGPRALYRITEALPVADVLLCHRAYAFGHRLFDAAHAGSELLGGGLSSRLFTRVREDLGLVYDIHSSPHGYSDTGSIDVSLSVGVENLVQAVRATLEVVKRTAEEGFTGAELERYKEGARCGMDMLCDQAGHLADWFGRQELLLGPDRVVTPEQYVGRQEALALEDLHRVMKSVFVGSGAHLVVVGPYGAEEQRALREAFPAEEAGMKDEG